MAAGHIVGSVCVDVSASTDAYFGRLEPATTPGLTTYYTTASKELSGWQLRTYNDGVLVQTSALVPPSFPSCQTDQSFKDGAQLGWGVAAAMVVVFVIRRVFR
jgi:hypothetical protein